MHIVRSRSMKFANARRVVAGVAITGVVVLAGCVSPPLRVPPVPLELVTSGELALPAECVSVHGAAYRVSYVVQQDGRVSDVASQSGSGCIQEALRAWVSTFMYRPVDRPTQTAIDWIEVRAARGG